MRAVILDTETTDLVINRTIRLEKCPEIIEYYGCLADLDSGEIIDEVDTLIKPRNPVDEKSKAHKTVGLTNAMLADALPFKEVAPQILFQIETAPLIIAHNVSFDRDMLDIEFERIGQYVNWPPLLCTVEQTVWLKGFRLDLNGLHQHLFGEKFEGAHRAKVDVQALLRCVVELRRRDAI